MIKTDELLIALNEAGLLRRRAPTKLISIGGAESIYAFPHEAVAGDYVMGIGRVNPVASTLVMVANRLYGTPLYQMTDRAYDRLAMIVQTAAAAGAKARIGIYRNLNASPSTLLVDGGEIDVDTTGLKEVVIAQTLSKGVYWLAIVSDNTPTIQRTTEYFRAIRGGSATVPYTYLYGAHAYAALPDPFPAITIQGFTSMPTFLLRAV